ncbi:MAG: phosphate ABC transporter substrate-binding/OmpA family protein [Wenzhouxiangella sp.]|jgi:phosphate transport system substrate-binding protein|nr:phosphate ABC transporter substrate-binding/OmpA family protein [Wenzhouxiangella sp.]
MNKHNSPMPSFFVKTLMLLLALLIGAAPAAAQLRLHGSNTVGESLAPALAEAWLTSEGHEHVTVEETAPLERVLTGTNARGESIWVEIHAHGSSTSFRDLANGTADMGMASRRIKQDELERLGHLGSLDDPRHEFVVGIDGLAVIVHPDNPVRALRIDQIRAAFSGRYDNWRQLGGPDRPIARYARDDKSGTWDSFESMVLQDARLAADARRFESSSELSDLVANDPGGIGFIGLPYVRDARALAISAGGEPVAPERFTAATEDYPLSRRLYMYVPEQELDGLGGRLARFAVSREGQAIVDEIGFVGQKVELERVAIPESAPGEYRRYVQGALRASMNFRFEPGEVNLDSKSQRDLERLIEFLTRPDNRSLQVLLMGFADPSETSPYFSIALSHDRVDLVAAELAQSGVGVRMARGFGAALPLAEGTGPSSEAKNRRVEVWLRARDDEAARRSSASSP